MRKITIDSFPPVTFLTVFSTFYGFGLLNEIDSMCLDLVYPLLVALLYLSFRGGDDIGRVGILGILMGCLVWASLPPPMTNAEGTIRAIQPAFTGAMTTSIYLEFYKPWGSWHVSHGGLLIYSSDDPTGVEERIGWAVDREHFVDEHDELWLGVALAHIDDTKAVPYEPMPDINRGSFYKRYPDHPVGARVNGCVNYIIFGRVPENQAEFQSGPGEGLVGAEAVEKQVACIRIGIRWDEADKPFYIVAGPMGECFDCDRWLVITPNKKNPNDRSWYTASAVTHEPVKLYNLVK